MDCGGCPYGSVLKIELLQVYFCVFRLCVVHYDWYSSAAADDVYFYFTQPTTLKNPAIDFTYLLYVHIRYTATTMQFRFSYA